MDQEQFYLELISQGESQEVEFKIGRVSEQDLGRILTAFANTKGGHLFIGISDSKEVVGLTDVLSKEYEGILDKVCRSIFPKAIEIQTLRINGKNVVHCYVEQLKDHEKPILTAEGKIFLRQGGQIVLAQKDYIDRLKKIEKSKEISGFIAMSFRTEEEPALIDYYNAMLRAVGRTSLPIKLNKMDLQEGDYEISQQILTEIKKADFLIADFTLNSHNVYFEAGCARGNSKKIIQCARKDTNLQFDVKNWRTIIYRNATELEEQLTRALIHVYEEIS